MKVQSIPPIYRCIGLVDADLLDNGSRHPNLALLKIAGFLYDNDVLFELILDSQADISRYDRVYLSKVFTFTQDPHFYISAKGTPLEAKFEIGGTGFYATEKRLKVFSKSREDDMTRLEQDEYLNSLDNHRGGPKQKGIDMAESPHGEEMAEMLSHAFYKKMSFGKQSV